MYNFFSFKYQFQLEGFKNNIYNQIHPNVQKRTFFFLVRKY